MRQVTGELTGRVAVVTGAAAGIGRAIAVRLAELGAAVAVVDVDPRAGAAAVEELTASGGQALLVTADVSRAEDVDAMVQEVVDRFGRLDILVNNAGIQIEALLEATDPDAWDRVLDVDLNGAYLCSRRSLSALRAAGAGNIVNIASVHAMATIPGFTSYAAAKGGLVALTRAMALELGPDRIRVNAVCPGFIRTAKLDDFLASKPEADSLLETWEALHAVGRMGEPEDVADLVAFVVSDRAGFITGAALVIDGGLTSRLF